MIPNCGYTKFHSDKKFSCHRILEKFGDLARVIVVFWAVILSSPADA
jgi:hypothetical protein